MGRIKTEINTSSMADIAFLLIVFFLVATTIDLDSGLERKLPAYAPDNNPPVMKERNILNVKVNNLNEIMINKDIYKINDVRKITTDFLTGIRINNKTPETKIENIAYIGEFDVSQGIISLQNDRGTSYNMYIQVLNEITAAGNKVRNDLSRQYFGKQYSELSEKYKNSVNQAIPCIISEAEPRWSETE